MSLKLYYSPTSPYARKVRIAIIELGLEGEVESEVVNPFAAGEEYFPINPLSKIPTLQTHDGVDLPDSRQILEYLQDYAASRGVARFTEPQDRWQHRRRLQLADGIIDAAVAANLEQRREPALVSRPWFDRQTAAVRRTLDDLEGEAPNLQLDGPLTLAEINLIAALGYLDLRLASLAWREGRPVLAAWFSAASQRPSARATEPIA